MTLLQQIQLEIQDSGLDLTLHAQIQITSRRIAVSEIKEALYSPEVEVIEDYPGDPRGPSCLVYGRTSKKTLHVHVSHPPGIVVITAYEPNLAKWEMDLKTRKKK
jgi:hypothetical protein